MKSYKDMINEVLTKSTPAGEWIKDFVDSDNPKFAGKSAAKRKQMALAAYYAKQNESAAASQNSTAEVDMREAKEHHLVHVSDGSKYDEVPHEKDIKHVKTGAMHTGGQFDSYSDKGAFFKFKSKEDAEQFRQHVNKAPHKSVDAEHVNEAVEYKGIGTDVVDKKKKLNPQPNFTMAKKQVKDFKEEKDNREYGYEGDMAMSQLKTIIRHSEHLMGMLKPDTDLPEWVQSKITLATDYMQTAHDYLMSEVNEEVEQIDEGENGLAAKAKKSGISLSTLKTVYKRGVAAWNSGHRPGTTPQQWGMARVNSYITKGSGTYGGADKDLHEDARLDKTEYHKGMSDSTAKARVAHWKKADKLSDSNPKAYEPAPGDKTAKTTPSVHTKKYHAMYGEAKVYDPITKKMVATKPIKVQAGGGATRNGIPVETGPSKYKQSLKKEEVELIQKHEVKADAPHKDGGHVILSKAGKNWHVLHNKKSSPSAGDLHRSKLLHSYDDEKTARAKFKELKEEVQIDEVSKSTLMRYIPKASRDVADHVAMAKERQVTMAHATHAGNYDMAKKESGKSQISFKKAMQRLKGIDTATKKLGTQKEEVEHIDELSKGLVARYANKVAKTTQDNYDKSKDKFQFSSSRQDGMKNAVKRLTKEEAELDEAIAKKLPVQHAVDAVHATLGPKSATRFLSHLSPGSDKHTSWDKVNDALVKQGVQTHHIASIAQKTSHMNEEVIDESRGHKVLNTFFKNREVAQRAYQGNPAKDAEVAQGGGSPADQGIAAAKADYKKMNKENVNPALMAILKKRQEAQKKKAEDKKKVNEAKAPAVHAAPPKKTKSTAKEYASASIPGTKRVAHAKPDDNEVGGGTATRIAEDQYTSEYKIKSFVDPVTGENKTRKIRPHRINFKSSKMNAAPAQMTEPTKVTEGHDDYSSIAKELIKKHGKNVTAQHVKDFAGERDTHRGLDHAEVMHHVKKLSEDDKVYDEKWKKVKFTDFIKGAK